MTIISDLPLEGKTIVLTRAQAQQGEANELFTGLGAQVLELPALVIGPPDSWDPLDYALSELNSFDWVIFSSYNGVRAVEERLNYRCKALADFCKTLKIAAVGRKTALSLEKMGLRVDLVPPDFIADSLIKHFPKSELGTKILLPRVQSGGRTLLASAFREAGLKVVEVAAYESSCPKEIPDKTLRALKSLEVDAIAFTSAKTAIYTSNLFKKYFGDQWQKKLDSVKILSIGPQTSEACKRNFNKVDYEADPHDLEGLIKASIQVFKIK